ncbi:11515_t:CDS:2, partial [Acaulospora morrowiae]
MSQQKKKPYGFDGKYTFLKLTRLSTFTYQYNIKFSVFKSYFTWASNQNVIPSLSEFVRLNVDFVARSSTQTSDLLGLEGAWAKRFDSTAEILNIEESITIIFSVSVVGASVGFTDCGFTFPTLIPSLCTSSPTSINWSCVIERWHM